MSETSFSLMLRNLANEYYNNHISFGDYRTQRKIILDKIDENFNGSLPTETGSDVNESTSIFMQTISFFNNTDVDK